MVLGSHYQGITTVTPDQIQAILTTEAATFPGLSREALVEAGYALPALDSFGMGDSPDAEGDLVKTSHQQACLDMLTTARGLLAAEHVAEPTDLFLSGWSQGALVTLAFLEKLEQLGMPVRAVSTASTPAHLVATTTAILRNPRDGRDSVDPARTGIWLDTIIAMAFALEHSYQEPGFAATVIRPEFLEAARRFAARDHVGFEFARETTTAGPASGGSDSTIQPAASQPVSQRATSS